MLKNPLVTPSKVSVNYMDTDPLLTIFVVRSNERPIEWFNNCLKSLQHSEIKIVIIEGTKTLPDLLKLRLTLPSLADTKYMAFVDDDDWILPRHIQPMLDILSRGNYGGIYSDETLVSLEGRTIGHRDSGMKVFNPSQHYRNLIDTHHLTIVDSNLARQAAEIIPTDDIYLEPLLYGLIGLIKPLIHYPHRTYFWRQYNRPSLEKRKVQSIATGNAGKFYYQQIKQR